MKIRWNYFWRLFLLLFTMVWIWFTGGFVNYSSATVQEIWLGYRTSDFDSSLDLAFLKWWAVLSQSLWTAKSVLAIKSNSLFWWAKNWVPYFYDPNFQGFFNSYFVCAEFTGGITSPTDCVEYPISLDDDRLWDYTTIFQSYFLTVDPWDTAFYDYYYQNVSSANWYARRSTVQVCFSSDRVHSSICFRYSTCSNSQASGIRACQDWQFWWLTASQNLTNLTFANIPVSYLWYAPWQGSYLSNSAIQDSYTSSICPTVWELLRKYDNSVYNTWLCYSPTVIYSWWAFQQVIPSSIFDLFTDFNEYKTYLSLYANYCNTNVYADNTLCTEAFTWKYLQYVYIANLKNWNFFDRYSDFDLYQYCNLALNHDPNTTTCVWSGVYQWNDQITNEDVINSIANSTYNPVLPSTWYVNGGNTVYNNFLNNYIAWENNNSTYTWDAIIQINKIFKVFTSLFQEQTWYYNPILPEYIIIFLLLIILFRIFKK